MAATNPSYYQSGVCQDIRQKEHRFHLYMNQRAHDTPGANEKLVVPPAGSMWGTIFIDDFTIRDGPAANANLVARARGMHVADGIADSNWLFCHNIIFTDTRFKGSSLMMRGDFINEDDGEWAIVGGTGEFAYAHGVVTAKTKMGPWGGEGGIPCDIPQPPQSLETVTIGCYGDAINSVAFSYTDQAGQKKTAGPWGGDGPLTTTIKLAPSEVIKQVLGTTGDNVVTSLTLVSNLRTYGPFGKPNGTPFSSQVPDGKSVTGFFARAGASVNALGICYA
ncbi:hypothetical protein BAE44_0005849 [Dichanthelium oligosanthes]|uniref:Dirigent protein n=1 Tax=Dichanthelium oligosanthes TaxID=888268 RepID=A0A1E5W6X9_9POAL|nr:hypothetical protein BAE44_0005849 [Dichanthelium oligosanthes]